VEEEFQALKAFLHHQVLEIHVYEALRELLPEDDVRHSIEMQEERSGRPLQLDVAAVLGYQLVAISCTQSGNIDDCKHKGFEVLHRANLIGGAQARAVLVCLLDKWDCDKLEAELNDHFETDRAAFKVLGESVLADAATGRKLICRALRDYIEKELKWIRPASAAVVQ
jgi:hypothetical protein